MNWDDYYEKTIHAPPSPLLVEAIEYVENKDRALELGAGTPRDALFLREQGFEVVAVDKEESLQELFSGLLKDDNALTFVLSTFEDFEFKKGVYDLVSAQRTLPFLKDENVLKEVFGNIKDSLKPGGVFTGHFFGKNDTWCNEGKEMAFVSRDILKSLLQGMGNIVLREIEKDSETAKGTPHHWHIFEIIARYIE